MSVPAVASMTEHCGLHAALVNTPLNVTVTAALDEAEMLPVVTDANFKAVPCEKEPFGVIAPPVVSAVKVPATGVPVPIAAPGEAQSPPSTWSTFKLETFVVLAIVNGAVPVASVLVITPLAETVVNAPVLGVPLPMAPGAAKVAPLKEEAFKLATLVVLAMEKGAVPVASVLLICLS